MRILYATGASFNEPTAAGLRNLGLAAAWARGGHDVVIASRDPKRSDASLPWYGEMPENVRIVPTGAEQNHSAILNQIEVLTRSVNPGLHKVIKDFDPEAIVLYQSFLPFLLSLRRSARRKGVPFLLDVTEWYDGHSLPLGPLGPHNLMNQFSMRLLVPRVPAALTISRALAVHVSRQGARVLVVPPLFDQSVLDSHIVADQERRRRLRVAVTGSGISVGQKDRLGLEAIAEVAERLDPTGDLLEIAVAGPTREVVETVLQPSPPRSFTIHGPLSWAASLSLVADSDFTLMLRTPDVRRNVVGFPSKVSESLLLGTPILGNIIGDLDEYLVDGYNAAVVAQPDASALQTTIEGVLHGNRVWDRDEIRRQANLRFGIESHSERLSEFMYALERNG